MKGGVKVTLSELIELLSANIYSSNIDYNTIIKHCRASDLLSDVLMNTKEHSTLLTGLVNPQVIRTAEMMDINTIVFVRNKKPTQEMIDLAIINDITLLSTPLDMFICCGLLYNKGVRD